MFALIKRYGWLWVALGVYLLLGSMFRYHFGTLKGSLFLAVSFALVVLVTGVMSLRGSRRGSSSSETNAFESPHAVWAAIRDLLVSIGGLPDEADETRTQIDQIRASANRIGNYLAEHPGFLGQVQTEMQMALGDLMNAVERVWTTLADEHPDAAREAYADACMHVEHMRTFLPASTAAA